MINGASNDAGIANEFANHFSAVYASPSADSVAQDLGPGQQANHHDIVCGSDFDASALVTVELISRCIYNLKLGKACGPDDLGAEHLRHAHPVLCVYLKLLFCAIFNHGYVPDNFSRGVSVPLIKDKTGNINDVNNYRAITLTPVISRVLESVILTLCDDILVTDPLQFGFKRNTGCLDAIFTLKTVVNYFADRGSAVYVASLDFSKAFDKVSHTKMFDSLIKAGMPGVIVKVLCNWYGKLYVMLRWNGSFSNWFAVHSGVRQGSILSPALFNLFINILIVNLKTSGIGCHVYDQYIGCILYADDVILISPSVTGLQEMLDICLETASALNLNFNASKCHCIVFGKSSVSVSRITPMCLGASNIEWCTSIQYLGVYIVAGKCVSVDINPVKRAFYAACNCIFNQAGNLDEILQLTLQETYCLPFYYMQRQHVSLKCAN